MRNPFWINCDWVNPFRSKFNWLDFTLIHASGEYDCRFGNVEFHVALLGFHLGGQWKVTEGDTKFQAELRQMMDDLELSNPANFSPNAPVEEKGAEPMGWEKAP